MMLTGVELAAVSAPADSEPSPQFTTARNAVAGREVGKAIAGRAAVKTSFEPWDARSNRITGVLGACGEPGSRDRVDAGPADNSQRSSRGSRWSPRAGQGAEQ